MLKMHRVGANWLVFHGYNLKSHQPEVNLFSQEVGQALKALILLGEAFVPRNCSLYSGFIFQMGLDHESIGPLLVCLT